MLDNRFEFPADLFESGNSRSRCVMAPCSRSSRTCTVAPLLQPRMRSRSAHMVKHGVRSFESLPTPSSRRGIAFGPSRVGANNPTTSLGLAHHCSTWTIVDRRRTAFLQLHNQGLELRVATDELPVSRRRSRGPSWERTGVSNIKRHSSANVRTLRLDESEGVHGQVPR
jgi:hypothetical protein